MMINGQFGAVSKDYRMDFSAGSSNWSTYLSCPLR